MKTRSAVALVFAISFLVSSCMLRGERKETLDGSLSGHDVENTVTVVYDSAGVPHIRAENDEDLFYALGYVMAQDRFFFMDLMRKVGRGELCSLMGRTIKYKSYDPLTADKLMRSFQYGKRAKEGVASLGKDDKELLDLYVAGINRYLDDAGKKLPEYKATGIDPEPWTAEDSFVVMDVYGLSMTLWSLFHEYYGDRLVREIGRDNAELFMMDYPEDGPYINEDWERPINAGAFESIMNMMGELGVLMPGIGSNNWVVDGEVSASGMPILANDPHVPTALAPTFWYHVHLDGGSFNAAGLMFSGIPLMGAGTNGRVAWGITNARCDYIDLFREKVNPDDPGMYFFKGEWRRFETVKEKVEVKRGRDVEYTYRRSVHGAVIEERMTNVSMPTVPGQVLSLHLIDVELGRFFRGYMDVPRSQSASALKAAIRDMRMGPVAWNTVYATVDGDIGYLYSGHAPKRPDNYGALPRPGTGEAELQGWIPYDELPHVSNPDKHFIVTANNKVEGPDYPYYLSSGYNTPSRAERITEMLKGRTGLTASDMKDMQFDVKVMSCEEFAPLFIEDLEGEGGEYALLREELEEFLEGGCVADRDSGGVAVYKMIYRQMPKLAFSDELGDNLVSSLDLAEMAVHAAWKIMPEKNNVWWDVVGTPEVETRKDATLAAAAEAYAYLKKKMGKDTDDWRWGDIHKLRLFTVFGLMPWNRDARLGKWELGGTEESVNHSTSMFMGPIGFFSLAGPSSRIIVDMAEPDRLQFNATTGNSENPDSVLYMTTTNDWLTGRYETLSLVDTEYEQGALGILELNP